MPKLKDQASIGPVENMLSGAPSNINRILLANNMNPDSLRVNATTLREKEWEQMDAAVLKIARPTLVGINDLTSRGLVTRFNGLAKTVFNYDVSSDIEAAELNMKMSARSKQDRIEYTRRYIPLPVISKDYSLDIRELNASRASGDPLDTANAELAAYKVAYKAEQLLFVGSGSYTHGGGTIYGYLDHPQRETVTITVHWDHSGGVGAGILTNVNNALQKLINNNRPGPFGIYIPQAYASVMNYRFNTTSADSIGEVLRAIENVAFVKVSPVQTADKVAVVDLSPVSVDILLGLDITNFEWGDSPFDMQYKIAAIMVPRIKLDGNSKTGVCVIA
jgi:uncharacterized linocin/CFP29 family protein